MAKYLINFTGSCCELFIIIFFLNDRYNLRIKKKFAIPLCGLFLLFQFVTNNLFLNKSLLVIATSIVFIIAVSLIYEIKLIYRIVYTLFLYSIIGLSEFVIVTILSVFDVDLLFMQSSPLILGIATLSAKFFAYIVVLLTKIKRFKLLDNSLKGNVLLVFLLPIASLLIVLLFTVCCHQINSNWFNIITLIASVVLIFANIAVFYIIDKQNDLIATKEKLFFTEAHINSQVAHYQELYRHQTELRTFKHDIKNIFLSLMGILKEGDTEKALYAMQSNLDMLDEMNKNIINTGHPITDAILQSKLHNANSERIKLNISTKLTEKILVDELELGIILGNALDNAIEATAKIENISDKVVSFEMITTTERIVITIENPVNGDVNPGKLTTTKTDKINHGHGIRSIKTIAEKYDGVAEFAYSNGVFITNINIANVKPNR